MDDSFSGQAVKAAYGWGRPRDWLAALNFLEQAASAGEERADQQLALMTQMPIEQLLAPPKPTRLHPEARIAKVEGFAPPGFADWLIDRSRAQLQPAKMNDVQGVSLRTAHDRMFQPEDWDLVICVLQERAARLLGAPIPFHEPPSTIHYDVGQEFRLHVDFVDPEVPEYQEELALIGQRVGTVVTYLNDDFDGAETEFPFLPLKYRGATGDAIYWANVLPNGQPDLRLGHQALSPTRGEKWVLSQWIRSKPLPIHPA